MQQCGLRLTQKRKTEWGGQNNVTLDTMHWEQCFYYVALKKNHKG